MTDPVRVLWSLLIAGTSHADDRLLVRGRLPNDEQFAGNGSVGELVSVLRAPGEFGRFRAMAEYDDLFAAAVLRRGREDRTTGVCSFVWARLESAKDLKELGRFPHGPTLIIREGSSVRRVALWALDRQLRLDWIEQANKRLAYRLRTKQKWAHPEVFWIPVPGSTLRHGRERRPLLVRAEVVAPQRVYEPRQLLGGLKDPPPPRDFTREGVAA